MAQKKILNSYSSEDLYTFIKDAVINFEYPPGTQISENDIAKKFNVSRTPVKAVFTRLESEGFLTVLPQRGTYVSYLDSQNVHDFIYMRLVLEMDILRKFINQLTDDDISHMESLIKKQLLTTETPNFKPIHFLAQDIEFHGYIYEKVGHLGIWREIQKLQSNYTRFRLLDLTQSSKFNTLIDEHNELFKAIKQKDISKCKDVLHKHLEGNFEKTINSDLKNYFI